MPNLILIGCGGVGCAFLELLTKIPLKKDFEFIIIDPRDISVDPIINELRNII
jgi:tRNA A37 threonylcarbamoyladenosine dehydratase